MTSTSPYIFKALGPAPIQDPFQNRLNRAASWGAGMAAGAINALEMMQDPITKNGWLYAGAVNGGVWGKEYKAAEDSWGEWRWLSGGSDYEGVQSISKIKTTEDNQWLIAASGNTSNYGNLSGEIAQPLQIAKINNDGSLSWMPRQMNAAAQDVIKGRAVSDIAISGNSLIIGTNKGVYVSEISSDGRLSSIQRVEKIGEKNAQAISVSKSGRIYAGVLGDGLYTTTPAELVKDPTKKWEHIPSSKELVKDAQSLRLDTSIDSTREWENIFLGVGREKIESIYAAPWTGSPEGLLWSHAKVSGSIGTAQANTNFSFATDPTDPYKIYAGGNFFGGDQSNPTYGLQDFSGGVVGVQFPGFNARSIRGGTPIQFKPDLETLYGTYRTPENAGGTGPHADSRAITYLTTKDGGYRIIESDDGGIYYKGLDLKSPWRELNNGLDTAESFYSDWSHIGNLAITAMQDNATAILSYNSAPKWLNINGGDGAIARFDDGIAGSNGISRSYHSAQQYGSGSGLWSQAFDSDGRILSQEYLGLNIVDEHGNIATFKDYEQTLLDSEILRKDNGAWANTGYPFYSPVETSAYRAGDLVLSGIRNIYEQILPHWANLTPSEAYFLPLLEDREDGFWRNFIDIATGSSRGLNFAVDKPRSWDALYASTVEVDPELSKKENRDISTARLYGRKAGTTSADWFKDKSIYQLRDLTAFLPKEAVGKVVSGITFNPDNPDQVWATLGNAKSKANSQQTDALQQVSSQNSYVIYSSDGGISWQVVHEASDNYLDIIYAPAKAADKPAELFISGYGGIWSSQLDANNRTGTFTPSLLQHGNQIVSVPALWIPELKYDPIDDVVVASTIGKGAWILSRSGSGITPIGDLKPGLSLTSVAMPQDAGTYTTRKGRPMESVVSVTLVRDAENANRTVTAAIELPNKWQDYLFFPDFYRQEPRQTISNNHINLSFPIGVDTLYIDVQPALFGPIDPKYGQFSPVGPAWLDPVWSRPLTIPDVKLDLRLVNANGASISKGNAYAYLYATLDRLFLNQLETGVFESPSQARAELAQSLEILMPRANLNAGEQLFWYPVDRADGSINISHNETPDWIKPTDHGYTDEAQKRFKHLASSSQAKDLRAFSPEKAYLAFTTPSIVRDSEGISIGELTTSSESGLPEHLGKFAFAIQDQFGNARFSPLGFSIAPTMDNAASFGIAGSSDSAQVVLAPGNGELFIADDSIFATNGFGSASDRILFDLSVARFTDTVTGYGIYRVDDLRGAFQVIDGQRRTIEPGSLDYAKEAIKRSLSGGLDGITGLSIPGYAQSIKHQLELATGNAYALYITPGQVINSRDQLSDLSNILFSVQNANSDRQLKQVSMATGYFAFDDKGLNGDRDFNDMLFALTPRIGVAA